jgi:hypothetical protein
VRRRPVYPRVGRAWLTLPIAPKLDDEVARLSDEAIHDRAARQKAIEGRAEHSALVSSWFSRQRVVLVALIVCLPILGLLVSMNLTGQSLDELLMPDPPPALALQQAQEALDAVVRQVRVYREDYSQLPDDLAEVGAPKGDWTYDKEFLTGRYRIHLKLYGQTVAFDSAESKTAPDAHHP